MTSIYDWSEAIKKFVNEHPNGVTWDEVESGVKFKKYKSSLEFGQLINSLVFHRHICKKNAQGELFNPNNFRNKGEFKFYPILSKEDDYFHKYYEAKT